MQLYKRTIRQKKNETLYKLTPDTYLIFYNDNNKIVFNPKRSVLDSPMFYPNQLKIISTEYLHLWGRLCRSIENCVFNELRRIIRHSQIKSKYSIIK